MKTRRQTLALMAGLAIAATQAPAQEATERRVETIHQTVAFAVDGNQETFEFISSELNFGGRIVKGAPYSAESTTETTQTLADGNRIVRQNKAMLYRDGEGRTRRKQTLEAVGPWAASGDPPQTIFINDPVARTNYALDPRNRTARRMLLSKMREGSAGSGQMEPLAGIAIARQGDAMGAVVGQILERALHPERMGADRSRTESLGRQTIEGVAAEGRRTILTIPAGEIGNDRPIEIVSERWYSPELQLTILSRRTDPRTGEVVTRLTNIRRAEPARSLFEVPPDYTIQEEPLNRIQIEKMRRTPEGR